MRWRVNVLHWLALLGKQRVNSVGVGRCGGESKGLVFKVGCKRVSPVTSKMLRSKC